MAEFTVTHSCGHEVRHRFDGPEPQRRQREQWLREKPCQICWHKGQTESATAKNLELALPPLEGAAEEIAWAEVIRVKAITHNIEFHKRVSRPGADPAKLEPPARAASVAADKALDELKNHAEASWWIDNRFDALNYVRKAALDAITAAVEADEQRSN